MKKGDWIDQGVELGKMGNSGTTRPPEEGAPAVPCEKCDFGLHVHFEVKDSPTFGNSGPKDAAESYWGYTPGHPDLYGYHDPRNYVAGLLVESTPPTALLNATTETVDVRGAPGLAYDGSTETRVVDELGVGQRYVAIKQTLVEGFRWFFVYLPSTNSMDLVAANDSKLVDRARIANGPNGGWVRGDKVTRDPGARRIEATDIVYVRKDPSSSSVPVARLYPGGSFATFDTPVASDQEEHRCKGLWYKTYVPGDQQIAFNGSSWGWVCEDFIVLR